MSDPLIGVHAFLGEFAVFAFFWIFVELFNPGPKSAARLQLIAKVGVGLLLLSWLVGGFYYLNIYGPQVKPIILAGPEAWAHNLFTETKEHVFLLLPFLGIVTWALLAQAGESIVKDAHARRAVQALALLIVLLGLSMAGMGFLISSGARAALEAGVHL